MTEFTSKWQENRSGESSSQRIKEALNPQRDLKKRLVDTDRSLNSQIANLDKTLARMSEKEKALFNKTSSAFQKHDTTMAHAFANELSEHRKAMKLVEGGKLSLEQVQLRLRTITDFGDLANVIAPVGQVVRTVRKNLQSVMPSANDTLSEINTSLDGMMQDIGNISGMNLSFDTNGEEAEKILAEASVIAETKMSGSFPSIPDISDQTTNTSI
ncbi:MAG: Snf7 family protein [Nitrososphaerota archaeon]|nr:Snf7 family protein [Nitrososphaerota archaeon]MDG6922664.1 Snf7 family protein [Nitrososphaerota archaeon]